MLPLSSPFPPSVAGSDVLGVEGVSSVSPSPSPPDSSSLEEGSEGLEDGVSSLGVEVEGVSSLEEGSEEVDGVDGVLLAFPLI